MELGSSVALRLHAGPPLHTAVLFCPVTDPREPDLVGIRRYWRRTVA